MAQLNKSFVNILNKTIKEDIDKNRDQIDKFLNSNLPLEVIYYNIRILSERNERLIKELM